MCVFVRVEITRSSPWPKMKRSSGRINREEIVERDRDASLPFLSVSLFFNITLFALARVQIEGKRITTYFLIKLIISLHDLYAISFTLLLFNPLPPTI